MLFCILMLSKIIASIMLFFATLFAPIPKPTPIPTPFNPFPYKMPIIQPNRSYLTYIVGDSMVNALGLNANILRLDLIKLYQNNEFVNYNYGFSSTNIESLPDRLNKETTFEGTKYPPILTQGFDLIIFESFAYNPLSQYPLADGLKKHDEILDEAIKEIVMTHPNSIVALMTPIAPNKENFAKYTYKLSAEQRTQWVNERLAYIERYIEYAKERNLPLINVYEKSLTPDGDGDLKYINKDDYIHPSKEGIALMSQTIANFIYQNKIFPS